MLKNSLDERIEQLGISFNNPDEAQAPSHQHSYSRSSQISG